MKVLNTCDVVVDVGGVYDHSKKRYDHHMREFNETAKTVMKKSDCNWDIKLSSAGLIYCHYGHEVIRKFVPEILDEDDIHTIFKNVYGSLIKEIDAVDNGIPMFDGEPKYRIVTSVGSRVSNLNPKWNSVDVNEDEQFLKAVDLVGEEFVEFIYFAARVWLPARSLVKSDVDKRFEVC